MIKVGDGNMIFFVPEGLCCATCSNVEVDAIDDYLRERERERDDELYGTWSFFELVK